MRSARFRAEREQEWTRLSQLLDRSARRGPKGLDWGETRELARLYRQTAHALALAREITLDRALLAYLERLTARAYLAVHAPPQTLGQATRRFLAASAPQAVRRRWRAILLAFLCLVAGQGVGHVLVASDPSWWGAFVPEGLSGGRGPDATREALLAILYDRDLPRLDDLSAFATSLVAHNTQVAIFSFALGILGGWATALLAFYNGTILGAFFAVHQAKGLAFDLFAWLSIHGVTELTAIAIACAGGFAIAGAVVFPGARARADALRRVGPDAARLAVLAAMMLLVAGLLEGYGRQLVQDPWARIAIGWGMGGLWLTWWLRGGRKSAS